MKVTSRCVGVAHYIAYCATGAITVFGKADIIIDCTRCGICLKFCPQKTIELTNGV